MDNDLISRQAVLDLAYPYGNGLEPEGFCVEVEDILSLPSAQPERKKGQWLWDKDETYYRCSECGHLAYETLYCMDGTYAYCPFCGAKMEGGEDERWKS